MAATAHYQSFDLLASLLAVVHADAKVVFSNAALEDALGISRRAIVGASLADMFTEPTALREALAGASATRSPPCAMTVFCAATGRTCCLCT